MFKIIWVYAVSYYDGPFDGKKRRKHYIGVCSPCFILYPHSNPIRFFRGESFAFSKWSLTVSSQPVGLKRLCYCPPQVKCDHYWPFTEEPIAYGDITVEMMSEEEQDDWACRHFRINYVSHGAGFQGPSPRWVNPQGQEAHPPSWETVSALDLVTLLPPREKCHIQCACFPSPGGWCG